MTPLMLVVLVREERFRLDGERDELRTIKKELDTLRQLSLSVQNVGTGLGLGISLGKVDVSPGGAGGINKENLSGGPFPPPHWLSSTGVKDSLGSAGGGGGVAVDAAQLMSAADDFERPLPHGGREGDEEGREVDPELARLRREREDLLSTGIYSASDPLIQELSRIIAGKEGTAPPSPPGGAASEPLGGSLL